MYTLMRRSAVFCIPSFLCWMKRLATAARGTGTSGYNFVQGSVTFVHPTTMFVQEPTTMVQLAAKMLELPPMEVFLFHLRI